MIKLNKEFSPYVTVRLLNALKGFYTFRKLEELLGIPSQVLWRYTSLINIPEKNTAEKIIKKIEEEKLVEKVINSIAIVNRYGFVNSLNFCYNIGFLNIVGYKAWKFTKGTEIDIVMSTSRNGDPLATIVAEWLKAKICPVKRLPLIDNEKYVSENFISSTTNQYSQIYIPKDFLEKNKKILIVEDILNKGNSTKALVIILSKLKIHVWGILTIVSLSDEWKNSLKIYGIDNFEILKNIKI